jgi:hypothetical protein
MHLMDVAMHVKTFVQGKCDTMQEQAVAASQSSSSAAIR